MTKPRNKSHPWQCANCRHNVFEVLETTNTRDTIRRRRKCTNCGERINTYESLKPPVVSKKSTKPVISQEQVLQIMRHLRIASGHLISISDLLPLPLTEKKR